VPGTIMNPNAITLLQSLLAQPALTLADIVVRFAAVIDCKEGSASDIVSLRDQLIEMEQVVSPIPAYRQLNISLKRELGSYGLPEAEPLR
ncbi:MAG: hypothetical protein ACRYHA_19955, partial [Janthinobacterium lividum]